MIPMKFGEILTMLFWEKHEQHGATMDIKKCFNSSPIYSFGEQYYLIVLPLGLQIYPYLVHGILNT